MSVKRKNAPIIALISMKTATLPKFTYTHIDENSIIPKQMMTNLRRENLIKRVSIIPSSATGVWELTFLGKSVAQKVIDKHQGDIEAIRDMIR